MQFVTYAKCPVCGTAQLNNFLNVPDHSISKQDFMLVNCGSCGFTFTQNPPSEAEIGPFYSSEEYISHSDTNEGLVNKLYHVVRSYMLGKKKSILKSFTSKKNLLDVGTGTGYFLNYMKQNGYETTGVEVSDDAKKVATEKFGLSMFHPNDLLNKQINKKFDIITLWHVLEHLYDLDKYMQSFDAHLNEDGVIAIAVPNKDSYDAKHYKGFWAAYDVPRHLWHFTPSTMKKLVENHGFEIKSMKRLPFDAFYNCMLSEKYKKNGLFLISGFIIGGISYLNSLFSVKKSSSIVYILKRKK